MYNRLKRRDIQLTEKPLAALNVYESVYTSAQLRVLRSEYFKRAYVMKRVIPYIKERFVLYLQNNRVEYYELVFNKFIKHYDLTQDDLTVEQYEFFVDFGIFKGYFAMQQNFKDYYEYIVTSQNIYPKYAKYDKYLFDLENFPLKVLSPEALKVGYRWQAMGFTPRGFHVAFMTASIGELLDDPAQFISQLPSKLDYESLDDDELEDIFEEDDLNSSTSFTDPEFVPEITGDTEPDNELEEKIEQSVQDLTFTEQRIKSNDDLEIATLKAFLLTNAIVRRSTIYIYPVRVKIVFTSILLLLRKFKFITSVEQKAAKHVSIQTVHDVGICLKHRRKLNEDILRGWYDAFAGYLKHRHKVEDFSVPSTLIETIKD